MSHIFNMWGNTPHAPTLISIDICVNCQRWWAVLWILGGLGCQSLTSRHAKGTKGLEVFSARVPRLAPWCLVCPTLLWRWHNPTETEMTKHCRSAFTLLWSLWRLCSTLVSASSADHCFFFFSVFRTAVTVFFLFFVGPLWCNYFSVHRNKKRNTYLIVEAFPSPETQTFHPICWFCFFSRTFSNDLSQGTWKSKKYQYTQFVFSAYFTNDSQRSLTYKNTVPLKYFQTAETKKKKRLGWTR